MSKISLKVVPLRFSISRSSSMKGISRRSARSRPSVDLPPPRVVRRINEMLEQQFTCFGQRGWRQPLEKLGEQDKIERGLDALIHKLRHGQADGTRNSPQQDD